MNAGGIAGRISLVGVEGNQAHEIAAVVVGSGDSALAFAAPTIPAPAETPAPAAPSSLPQQVATPAPPPAAVPPVPPTPPAATATPSAVEEPDDLWQVQGKVAAITMREFVIETRSGESVLIDVSRLSSWTRETVRPGDQVKLFGVPQKDRRLVANGFIQEVTPGRGASR